MQLRSILVSGIRFSTLYGDSLHRFQTLGGPASHRIAISLTSFRRCAATGLHSISHAYIRACTTSMYGVLAHTYHGTLNVQLSIQWPLRERGYAATNRQGALLLQWHSFGSRTTTAPSHTSDGYFSTLKSCLSPNEGRCAILSNYTLSPYEAQYRCYRFTKMGSCILSGLDAYCT